MSYAMGNRPPAHDGAAPADEDDDDAVQTLWRVVYQEGTSLNSKNKGLHDKGGGEYKLGTPKKRPLLFQTPAHLFNILRAV